MMTSLLDQIDLDAVHTCPNCGSESVEARIQEESFESVHAEGFQLQAHIPIWTCAECGFEYTDGRGEDIKHAAICAALNRLSPLEVKELRKSLKVKQKELADLTKFGIASIKRWETGAQIPSESADRFLKLISDPIVFSALQQLHIDEEQLASSSVETVGLRLVTDYRDADDVGSHAKTNLDVPALPDASYYKDYEDWEDEADNDDVVDFRLAAAAGATPDELFLEYIPDVVLNDGSGLTYRLLHDPDQQNIYLHLPDLSASALVVGDSHHTLAKTEEPDLFLVRGLIISDLNDLHGRSQLGRKVIDVEFK